MKTRVMLMMMTVAVMLSCNDDNQPYPGDGTITFVIPVSENIVEPASLVVSVEDEEGKSIFQDKILSVTRKNQQYTTEKIQVGKGSYYVTKFIVLSNALATYATPREGSQKATLIDEPLPLEFHMNGNQPALSPTLVGIAAQDEPELFGYTNFDYDGIDDPAEEWMNIRVKFELTVGQIYYPDVDATFIVSAYDENNIEQWEEQFTYIGPQPNDLRIKNGFHHYNVEAKKWGTSSGSTFIGTDLWNDRVREGAVPITWVFTKSVDPKKIASYVRSSQQQINGEIKMVPDSKAVFDYDNEGKVKSIDYLVYATAAGAFVPDKRSEFTYVGNAVSKIRMFEVGTNTTLSEDYYTYDATNQASHIQHKESGTTTEVGLTYAATDRVIKAIYRLSNGNGFEYEFSNESGNAKTDRTTRGSQVCSEGVFTYDKNINPLKHLGYVDFLFRNYSNSNRLTEDVEYIGCAFPELVPNTYQYVYDDDGYPTVATTVYKGSDHKTQVEYFYQ